MGAEGVKGYVGGCFGGLKGPGLRGNRQSAASGNPFRFITQMRLKGKYIINTYLQQYECPIKYEAY